MDVLLINVPLAFNMNENLEPPLGVTYMGAMLRKHGHRPLIKDYEVEEFDPDVFKKYIAEKSPSFVGISSRTASYSSAKYLTELVKEVNDGRSPARVLKPWLEVLNFSNTPSLVIDTIATIPILGVGDSITINFPVYAFELNLNSLPH